MDRRGDGVVAGWVLSGGINQDQVCWSWMPGCLLRWTRFEVPCLAAPDHLLGSGHYDMTWLILNPGRSPIREGIRMPLEASSVVQRW